MQMPAKIVRNAMHEGFDKFAVTIGDSRSKACLNTCRDPRSSEMVYRLAISMKSQGIILPVFANCSSRIARSLGVKGKFRPLPFFVSPGSSLSHPAFKST